MSLPPLAWFQDPALTELTPLTVTKDGQVFGLLAGWSIKHRSFPGRNITAPRSPSGYRHFATGSVEVSDGDGTKVIRAGNLTIGGGHADTSLSANDARRHYDEAGSIVAQVAIGEDAHGIWYSGALMPDVDELTLRRFRACALSGDWRSLDGHALDLVAALAVPTPGFPIARVASSAPLSLVAAGALAPSASFGRVVDPAWEAASVPADKLTADGTASTGSSGMRLEISDKGVRFFGVNGEEIITARPVVDPKGLDSVPSPATLAALIDKRLDERREAAELAVAHAALAAEVDETPQLVASLLAASDDTPGDVASLLADLDETPERVEALLASLDEGDADPKELSV